MIMSLSMLAIAELQLNQAQLARQQQQQQAAWDLIDDKITELRNLWGNSVDYQIIASNRGGNILAGNMVYGQYQFNLTWDVSIIPSPNPQLQIKRLQIYVRWQQNQQVQTLSAETLLSQH